jgi:hypothetical protein
VEELEAWGGGGGGWRWSTTRTGKISVSSVSKNHNKSSSVFLSASASCLPSSLKGLIALSILSKNSWPETMELVNLSKKTAMQEEATEYHF